MPDLNGVYQFVGADKYAKELDNNRPVYVKEGGDFFCYFWYDGDDEESNGWYFADEVASEDYLAFNPAAGSMVPPERGWLVEGKDTACVFKVVK